MVKVVSVKFNPHGKTYYFDPEEIEIRAGDTLIVETSKGVDIGICAYGEHYVTEESVIAPLRPVIRIATEEDLKLAAENKEREKEALVICREKIAAHGLEMKLVDVECGFEGNKILFFFTADGRVDFRELVKDLAAIFRTRIELRQIGVRDETKMLGGMGICGRPYCCSQFLNEFQPVSTKMAKTQSMSLNPTKISGSCGRLMCCLRYEQEAYDELLKTIPKNGAFVQTPQGYGNVIQTNVLRQKVKVRIDGDGAQEVVLLDADEVAAVPGGRPKLGEPLPDLLKDIVRKKPEKEPEEDIWAAPNLFAEDSSSQARPEGAEKPQGQRPRGKRPEGAGGNQEARKKPANAGGKPRQQGNKAKAPVKQTEGGQKSAAAEPAKAKPAVQSEAGGQQKGAAKNKKRRYYKPKGGGQNKA